MAVRVLAPGEAGEEDLAGPPQLAHADLGGVIRARDPALQLVEAVAGGGRALGERRGDDHGFAVHPEVRRLGGLRGGDGGEQLCLLAFGQRLPRVVVAGLRLAVDTPDNQRKFLGALGWIDGEATARYNHPWKALTEAQQTELLTAVSTAEPAEPPHFWVRGEAVIVPPPLPKRPPTTRDRFDELKGWIAGAYYSSEIGMRELGWTGQTFFASFPGCEHPGGHR
jgi:hypothetical protein